VLAAVTDASHHLVLTAKQFKRPGGVSVEGIHFARATVFTAKTAETSARRVIREIHQIQQFIIKRLLAMCAVYTECPAVIKVMFNVGEHFTRLNGIIRPVGGSVGTAVIMRARAVCVPGWQAAPGRVAGVIFLIIVTERHGGVIGHIGIHHAVEEFFTLVIAIQPAVLILITGYHAPAHRTFLIQRAGSIEHVTLFVPASVTGADIAGEFFAVGVFTHHVDRGGRIARPGHQACGATHHFDAVINRGVFGGITKIPGVADGRWNVVVSVIIDVKTAGEIGYAFAVDDFRRDAGGVIQHVAHRLEVLILHALFGDHTDRLRNIARRQVHFGARSGGFDRVILPVAGSGGRRTFNHHILLRAGCGGIRGACRPTAGFSGLRRIHQNKNRQRQCGNRKCFSYL